MELPGAFLALPLAACSLMLLLAGWGSLGIAPRWQKSSPR